MSHSYKEKCLYCGQYIETGGGGLWYSTEDASSCPENRGGGAHFPARPEQTPATELAAQAGKRVEEVGNVRVGFFDLPGSQTPTSSFVAERGQAICAYCGSASDGFCENCAAPLCAAHDSMMFEDVMTCADAEGCHRRCKSRKPCKLCGKCSFVGDDGVQTHSRSATLPPQYSGDMNEDPSDPQKGVQGVELPDLPERSPDMTVLGCFGWAIRLREDQLLQSLAREAGLREEKSQLIQAAEIFERNMTDAESRCASLEAELAIYRAKGAADLERRKKECEEVIPE